MKPERSPLISCRWIAVLRHWLILLRRGSSWWGMPSSVARLLLLLHRVGLLVGLRRTALRVVIIRIRMLLLLLRRFLMELGPVGIAVRLRIVRPHHVAGLGCVRIHVGRGIGRHHWVTRMTHHPPHLRTPPTDQNVRKIRLVQTKRWIRSQRQQLNMQPDEWMSGPVAFRAERKTYRLGSAPLSAPLLLLHPVTVVLVGHGRRGSGRTDGLRLTPRPPRRGRRIVEVELTRLGMIHPVPSVRRRLSAVRIIRHAMHVRRRRDVMLRLVVVVVGHGHIRLGRRVPGWSPRGRLHHDARRVVRTHVPFPFGHGLCKTWPQRVTYDFYLSGTASALLIALLFIKFSEASGVLLGLG